MLNHIQHLTTEGLMLGQSYLEQHAGVILYKLIAHTLAVQRPTKQRSPAMQMAPAYFPVQGSQPTRDYRVKCYDHHQFRIS